MHSVDPTPRSGQLAAIDAGWAVRLDGSGAAIPAGSLVSLRREGQSLPPRPRQPGIILANGDRIRGTILGGDARAVRFAPMPQEDAKREPWSVPLSALSVVWVTAPPADTPMDRADYPWADGPKRRDTVLLSNGDVLRGIIEGFAAEPAAVLIKTPTEVAAIQLPLSRVKAIAFDPSLARLRKPKGTYTRLVSVDGSRLTLTTATADQHTLKGTTAFGAKIELPLAEVAALDVMQGKATYLSDLKPRKATVEGFNGITWPWAPDRTVKGKPLRIGDQTFDKGLGTHSRTTLVYDLGGKYRRFEAIVGLDPETGRRGAVDIRILVDGREAPLMGFTGLTAGTSPRKVVVDITKAKELTLVVDYGTGGDVQDDVNWGDARLIE